ncbi:MAG: hemerythrin domain-containing protein [Burkholderiaceae bacterium]|nr:hemerythrin domain-containing protein [Burkholderiaceae bacterium]
MSQANNAPIQDFSECHAGIRKKLDMLGELPALLAPAARAREVAETTLEFFREAIFEHHLDEERELFPAVLDNAQKGEEYDRARAIVKQLTEEHREIERLWKSLESGLKKAAKGHATDINVEDIARMVRQYKAHAQFEETEFLPLSEKILGRNSDKMMALGMALHMRHTKLSIPEYI